MYEKRGSALVLILIAVALFAALSYAVTRTGQGSIGSTNREDVSLALAEGLQNVQSMKRVLDRIMIVDGFTVEQISVVNSVWPSFLNGPAHNENSNCTVNTCRLFHPDGGDLTYRAPPALLGSKCPSGCAGNNVVHQLWLFNGKAFVPGLGAANASELMVATRVDQQTCMLVNQLLGIENPGDAAPQLASSFSIFVDGYKGTFASSPTGQNTFPAELDGQRVGCVNQQHPFYSSDFAWLYVVLLER